ncbi:DUF3613 domain-containing protein [Methylotuvimicrobium buryatense]|uniref:DUF3613 domain-containing protein n=2 Tax=Methylotuvimicrobium buryatense TaxID=95641 RepID=A0A4P9USQ7_METBY|nr:DUF3613 domain-containing protein [Methylotuvimicrobium buryatense]QCW83573.1 DUF3613 domain-containing protein [Methylotuvimicrobium buryatense]
MMSINSIAAGLSLIFLFNAGSALAESPKERTLGEDTRRWLELQRSGSVASSTRQTVSGPVAHEIHKRYVESFTHTIPEYFKMNQDGISSGTSN